MNEERGYSAAAIDAKLASVKQRAAGQQKRVPLQQYVERFSQADPQLLSARSGVAYDADSQEFHLTMLGRPVIVRWPSLECVYGELDAGVDVITHASDSHSQDVPHSDGEDLVTSALKAGQGDGDASSLTEYERILLACLLLEGTVTPASGSYISYAEIPNGTTYYQAYKRRCLDRFVKRFGADVEGFKRASSRIGGVAISEGDVAYEIEFVNGVFVRLILWEGDDEYPANAQITYSDNIVWAFNSESTAVLTEEILAALG